MGVSLVRVAHGTRTVRLGLEECVVGNARESGSLVDDRCVVNPLVNSVGVVDHGRLDGLSLDDGLDWAERQRLSSIFLNRLDSLVSWIWWCS